MLALLEDDITGIVATGLCQHGAGDLHILRQILRDIFANEVEIIFDMPPKEFVRHREEVHALHLPWPEKRDRYARSQYCSVAMRRYVLSCMLNGDLEDFCIHHYCPVGCCRDADHTLEKLCTWIVWALLPHKCPRYIRGKWLQQGPAVNWCGLLAAHHALLPRVMMKYTGCPQVVSPSAPTSASDERFSGNTALTWDTVFALQDAPQASDEPAPTEEADVGMAFAEVPEEAHGEAAELQPTGADTDTDWKARNKQYKQKCGRWSQSQPGSRLVIAAACLNITSRLLHACLRLSGEEWERAQVRKECAGKPRDYRIVQAAKDDDTKTCMRLLGEQLDAVMLGLQSTAMTVRTRALAFRLLSRSGCALQILLRHPRRGEPYATFLALDPERDVRETPECMKDEFSSAFSLRFPDMTAEAHGVLEMIARNSTVDIAQLESRHASIRRLAYTRGVHTWVPHFGLISADFTCRDLSLEEFKWRELRGQVVSSPSHPEKEAAGPGPELGQAENQKTEQEKKRKKQGGGGGAWRAYLHLHHSQRRFSQGALAQTKEAYRNLAPAERAKYQRLGALALLAWRQGNRHPFGQRMRVCQQPALEHVGNGAEGGEGGVMVAVVDNGSLAQLNLVARCTRDFEEDVKTLRARFRAAFQQEKAQDAKALAAEREASLETLRSTEPLFQGVPAEATFASAAPAAESAALASSLTWSPPSLDVAKALLTWRDGE